MCAALRRALAAGYDGAAFRADVLAGLVVGVVALPLSMALAVAVGVPPQHGLYTAIVAGAVVALLGGSRVQVSGPTAAFVVILAPIVARHGLQGLAVATVLAGLLQAGLGLARLGRLIQLVPYPVVVGFTAGVALVIATLQLEDFLGLRLTERPQHYLDRVHALARALPTAHVQELALGAATLAVLVLWPRLTRRVPAPLVALTLAAAAAHLLGLEVATIRDRFHYETGTGLAHGVPQLPPRFAPPWTQPGPEGAAALLSWALLRDLLPSAFAIAMLGALESLLSAVMADGMTGDQHDPDSELVAQGVGNVIAPFFGGFAATGALARTATNARAGARSPIAGVVHALVVLAAVLALAPLLGYLPMASLAALLLLVAWNMAELRHVVAALRTSPRSDSFVLLSCFALTVIFDMVIAVGVGMVFASFLFMRRMIEVSDVRLVEEHHAKPEAPLPPWVVWYEIAGPLFFGAAHRATSALRRTHTGARVVVLDLTSVPVIDATGLVNLRSALAELHRNGLSVILAGAPPAVSAALARAGLRPEPGRLALCPTAAEASALATAAAPTP